MVLYQSAIDKKYSLHVSLLCFTQVNFIQKLKDRYRNELDINGLDKARRTPLLLAADNGHVATLQVSD